MIVKEITNCHWFLCARFSSCDILKLSNKLNDVEESPLQKSRPLREESIYFNYYLCLCVSCSAYGTRSYVTYLISCKIKEKCRNMNNIQKVLKFTEKLKNIKIQYAFHSKCLTNQYLQLYWSLSPSQSLYMYTLMFEFNQQIITVKYLLKRLYHWKFKQISDIPTYRDPILGRIIDCSINNIF